MYQVTAHAVRHNKTIEVTISGFLPDSCHTASVRDIYPGGNRMYFVDPGYAQVFIEETSRSGIGYCLFVLVPWSATVYIPDEVHKEVEIYVNERIVLQIPVVEKGAQFIVIQLTGGFVPNGGYSIVPEGFPYMSIYTKVFGPASYADCDSWVKKQSQPGIPLLDALRLGYTEVTFDNALFADSGGGAPHGREGGGGGNPHGLRIEENRGGGSGTPRGRML